uniref:Uncharacterized protein n=1 Tax=Arundo donax TaxID=35708 RepID=A0A0A8XVT1_ARUDO
MRCFAFSPWSSNDTSLTAKKNPSSLIASYTDPKDPLPRCSPLSQDVMVLLNRLCGDGEIKCSMSREADSATT